MSLCSQSFSTGDMTRWTFGQFPFCHTWKWENAVSTQVSFIKAPTEKEGKIVGPLAMIIPKYQDWGYKGQSEAKVELPRAPRDV